MSKRHSFCRLRGACRGPVRGQRPAAFPVSSSPATPSLTPLLGVLPLAAACSANIQEERGCPTSLGSAARAHPMTRCLEGSGTSLTNPDIILKVDTLRMSLPRGEAGSATPGPLCCIPVSPAKSAPWRRPALCTQPHSSRREIGLGLLPTLPWGRGWLLHGRSRRCYELSHSTPRRWHCSLLSWL